jgi:hypothetical protein
MTIEHPGVQVHVRFRGRVFGPYSPDELRSMVRKGKTTSTWEISLDTQNWRPIQDLENLLEAGDVAASGNHPSQSLPGPSIDRDLDSEDALFRGGPAIAGNEDTMLPTGQLDEPVTAEIAPSESMWYYALNDQRQGPVPESQLAAMAANGTLSPSTLVWTVNMSEWRPLRETRLGRHLPAAPQVRQPVSHPLPDGEHGKTQESHPKCSFAEEIEVVLDEQTPHLRFWFRVLLGAAIVKAIVSLFGLFRGGQTGVLSLLCDMAMVASLIGVSLLVLRIIARLHLGVRFIARPKQLEKLYPVEQPKRRQSPWSNPVTDEE